MVILLKASRSVSRASALALAAAVILAPGIAHAGFFDQLFGGGTVTPSQPTYDYQAPQPTSPEFGTPIKPTIKKRIVIRDAPPVRQKTTDLMSDKTLHPGDAVMMRDGLHIYSGPESARHTARQFVPIDHSKAVSSKMRATLLAMDTTRIDPLKTGMKADTPVSGRSAAVTSSISKGFRITDARGNSVRYVGP